jgi:hypothetical protein
MESQGSGSKTVEGKEKTISNAENREVIIPVDAPRPCELPSGKCPLILPDKNPCDQRLLGN